MIKQDALEKVFENPGLFGCAVIKEGTVLDGGIDAPGGWFLGKALAQSLLGFADVNFEHMQAGQHMVPTLDVYLDNTVAAANALNFNGELVSGASKDYALVLTSNKNAPHGAKKVVLAKETSFLGHLLHAATALPKAVKCLIDAGFCQSEIFWGHSSCPIIMRNALPEEEAICQKNAQKAGCLVSVWLRCSDEEIKTYLNSWDGDGELRLHNVLSGNTFIGGKIDEPALEKCLL